MTKKPFYSIMFVCLGNICRSPTAEAVLRHKAKEMKLDEVLHVESSATSHWSLGQPPDRRSHAAASKRGITLSGSAKLFRPTDFQRFHYVLGADHSVVEDLKGMTSDPDEKEKIHLITFCSKIYKDLPIPDPYYQGHDGFELVLDMLDDACRGLLNHLYKVILLLTCSATLSALETDIGIGVRRDSLEWSVGMYGTAPNVLSELQWKNIWSLNGFAGASLPLYRNLVVSGWVNGGKIFSGEVWDRDYWGNNRTEMFSESYSGAEQGYLFDASVAFSQSIQIGSGILSEILGYTYHRLHLSMIEGWQSKPIEGIYHNPMPTLDSRYTAQFYGPFFGIDYQMPLSCYLLGLGYTFTLPRYRGEGFWNLRTDLSRNFVQEADTGFGHSFFLNFQMLFQPNLKWGLSFLGRYFKVYNGRDHVYCKDYGKEVHVVQKLNEVRWKELSLYLYLEYLFDYAPKRLSTRERLSHILQLKGS